MKTPLALLFASVSLALAAAPGVRAEGWHGHRGGHHRGGSHSSTRLSVSIGGPSYIYRHGPSYYGHGYGYRHGFRHYPSYYSYYGGPAFSYGYPGYYSPAYTSYSDTRANYVGSGLFWGALTGAVLGNNSSVFGHNGLRGAAIGAGAGLLIGSVAENNARRAEAATEQRGSVATVQNDTASTAVETTPAPAAPVRRVTSPSSSSSSPMAAANTLFGR